MKGNIRVFCRMRPFLPSELKSGNVDSNHVSFDDDESKVVINIDYYNLLLIYSFAYIYMW